MALRSKSRSITGVSRKRDPTSASGLNRVARSDLRQWSFLQQDHINGSRLCSRSRWYCPIPGKRRDDGDSACEIRLHGFRYKAAIDPLPNPWLQSILERSTHLRKCSYAFVAFSPAIIDSASEIVGIVVEDQGKLVQNAELHVTLSFELRKVYENGAPENRARTEQAQTCWP
ncbi:hypothetical protein F5146DRAFT_1002314 [Armillaria mellea]|nr:hypothetical protein F5146DRAFT_1002314 [Armillaria mellea]